MSTIAAATTTTTATAPPPLTAVQSQAIARLLAGISVAAVARELNIDRSTIYHWRNTKPQFRHALQQGLALLHELAADSLADLASTAVDTLRHLLTSLTTPPSVRLRAAESVLRAVQPSSERAAPPQPEPEQPAPRPATTKVAAANIPHNPTHSHTTPTPLPDPSSVNQPTLPVPAASRSI